MTRTKMKRLIDGLIAKYGDVVVAKTYDIWLSRTYVKDEDEARSTILSEVHLSNVDLPGCRADYERLADIASGKEEVLYIPVEIAESKALYNTPEQARLRRIASENAKYIVARWSGLAQQFFINPKLFAPDW